MLTVKEARVDNLQAADEVNALFMKSKCDGENSTSQQMKILVAPFIGKLQSVTILTCS